MKYFDKRGIIEDLFDLFSFISFVFFALFFIYAALLGSLSGRDTASLNKIQETQELENAITSQREMFLQQKEVNLLVLQNQFVEPTFFTIPGIQEYTPEELEQLRTEAQEREIQRIKEKYDPKD